MTSRLLLAFILSLIAQDTNCPAYPPAARVAAETGLRLDYDLSRYHASIGQSLEQAVSVPSSNNFIDDADRGIRGVRANKGTSEQQ